MKKLNRCRSCNFEESEFLQLNTEKISGAPSNAEPAYACDICISTRGLTGQPFATHLTNQIVARLSAVEALLYALFNQVDNIPKQQHHLH
jgi:hypothetical protein